MQKSGTGVPSAAGTPVSNYEEVAQETGVFDKTDYISGALYDALKKKFTAIFGSIASVDAIEEALDDLGFG